MRPVDGVTLAKAARILGTSKSSTRRLVLAGRLTSHGDRYQQRMLSLADVEQLAAQVYPWWDHLDDPASYWVTGKGAGNIVGLSRASSPGSRNRIGCRSCDTGTARGCTDANSC
jgi:hypothetical protein